MKGMEGTHWYYYFQTMKGGGKSGKDEVDVFVSSMRQMGVEGGRMRGGNERGERVEGSLVMFQEKIH
jgi:hypothetical protein